jgi:Bacterial Ig-like domain/Secretion system C-terminal sorting domain
MKRIVLLIITCCLYGISFAQNITAIEYFIDSDVGAGNGTAVTITPGPSINMSFNVSLAAATDGFHTLSVRTKDANNFWSVTHTTPFYKLPVAAVSNAPNINKMEYFIDADPGAGAGTDVPVTAGTSINGLAVSVSLASAADGFHTLTFRTRDANLNWSVAHSTPFYKLPAGTVATAPNINKMEYFIDADPGVGAGTDVPVTAGTSLTDVGVSVSLAAVTDGFHTLTFRTRDANNRWSVSHSTPFYKLPAAAISAPPNLVKLEYFIDTDPGQGAGTAVPITPAATSVIDLLVSVPVTNLSNGTHTINFRALDDLGRWSTVQTGSFIFGVSTPTVVVSSTATDPTSVSPIPITMTFSESVTGFDILDIVVTNGTAGNFAGTGAVYTADVTPTASGAVTINIPPGAAVSVTSTANTASNTLSRTYQAPKSNQTITFSAIAAKTLGDAPFNLSASASSGLTVAFSSTSNKVTIAGTQVTMTAAGSVTITANQAGNATFNAAPAVNQTFCINPAKPTISMSGAQTSTLVLTSSSATGNQWFLAGTAIAGATGNTHSVTGAGVYSVQVTADNCVSAKSNDFAVVVTGLEPRTSELKLHPNPASTHTTVSIPDGQGGKIQMSDLRGSAAITISSNKAEEQVDVERLSTGVYFVTVTTAKGVYRTRLVKK